MLPTYALLSGICGFLTGGAFPLMSFFDICRGSDSGSSHCFEIEIVHKFEFHVDINLNFSRRER